ncbi:hypothetical protein [Vagococcus salmoninarum]|uniref:hypothetical protein n=1 Tax=Vagococcus salmoninarum TaxID=2739 RepID=UPI00187F30BA|nr:hypothetical protein [Vagococcus salmoninarum]MBE9387814.1 hypothetical protein [Vagococcus salmoninarum]
MKNYNTIKLTFVTLIIATITTIIGNLDVIFSLLFSIVFVVLNVRLISLIKIKKFVILTLMANMIKLLLVFYQSQYKNIPMGGSDWVIYDEVAQKLLLTGDIKGFILDLDVNLFPKIVAIFYSIFGVDNKIIYYVVFLCALTTLVVFNKTVYLWTNNSYTTALFTFLIGIYPIQIIFSITFLREIPIQMLIILSFYHLTIFLKQNHLSNLLYAIMIAMLSSMMHAGTLAILLVYLLMMFMFNRKTKEIKIHTTSIILFLVTLLFLSKTPLWELMTQKFSNFDNISNLADMINTDRGNTSYALEFGNSYLGVLLGSIYKFLMFVLSPLPWQVFNLETVIAFFIDAIPRYIILYQIVMYIKRNKEFRESNRTVLIIIVLIWFLVTLIFSIGTNNYGTAMRHRSKLYPIEFLMLALTHFHKREGRSE